MAYNKWFLKFQSNSRFKESIIKSIEKTGIDLEFRSGKILTRRGYYCTHGHYTDKENDEEISREIDVFARKNIVTIKTNYGLTISVNLKIIAECKFHSERDLLVFGLEEEVKPNTSLRFPIFTNGTIPIYRIHGNTMIFDECTKLFNVPECSRSLIDIKYENGKLKRLEKQKEMETNIFNASEQVLSAVKDYFNRDLIFVKGRYEEIWNMYFKDIEERKLKEISTPPIMSRVIDEIKKIFDVGLLNKEFLSIYIFLPMIIVGEDTGLLKVVQEGSDKYTINNLEEIKWCLYLHAPSRPTKYSEILEKRYEQPILVCNIKYLEDCISNVESSINDLIKEMEENLNKHRDRIVEEILKVIHPIF
jgi:hypothetical protein